MEIVTHISLPPGSLSKSVIESLADKLIRNLQWILPGKYGELSPDNLLKIEDPDSQLEFLLTYFLEHQSLVLAEGDNQISICPDRFQNRTMTGYIDWDTSLDRIDLERHRDGVIEIMRLVNSPLAVAATLDAYDQFAEREIQSEVGTELTYTVRDYTKGLENAHWRMWLGKEYIDFFSEETLSKAPTNQTSILDDICFVEMFPDPSSWNTPKGVETSNLFKQAVGVDVFYDPLDPEKELRSPNFP